MMNRRFALVGLLLMGSGACALIYQVTWLRELRLVFGSTTAASAAVLAIFMGGLGMGNALLGRRADRQSNPLAFYAMLEGLIAITVGLSPWLIDACACSLHRVGRADGPWRAWRHHGPIGAFGLYSSGADLAHGRNAAGSGCRGNHARRREPAGGGDPLWREYGRGCGRRDGQHVSHAADARHAVYALVRLPCERRRGRQCLVLVAAARCECRRQ